MRCFVKHGAVAQLALCLMFAPVHADTPKDQLVVASTMTNVLTFDPAGITGRDTVQVLSSIYDTLAVMERGQEMKFIPRLAESWEIAPDNSSITFHLRKGMQFASGNPITADDVAWSYKRVVALNLAQSSFFKSRGFSTDNMDDAFEVVDDYTFRLNLPRADDPKMQLMSLSLAGFGSVIDRKEALKHEKNGDLAADWLRTNSAGSGAYTLDRWRSNEFIILKKNPNYWGPEPEMTRVLIRHLPESQTQRLQLAQGDIDIAYSIMSADLRALENNPDVKIESTPGAGFYYLAASMNDERLANPKVREALRYLIDYDGLDTAVMPYFGQKHQRPMSTGVMGLLPDPGFTYDPEHAKALLSEAGYPDGFKVTLRALSEPPFMNIATALQASLAKGGIDAEVITGSGEQVYGAMRQRKFELIVGRGGGGQEPHPDSNLRSMAYNPDNADDAKLTNYQAWRTGFYDPTLNKMIETALVEIDHDKQVAAYGDIQNYIVDNVTSIQPFSEVVDTAAYRSDIDGLIINPWLTRFETIRKNR